MSSLDSEGSRHFLSRVETLLEQRMFDLAQELAAEQLRRLPDDVNAWIAMCKVWTKRGRLDQVEEILREVENRISDWSRVYAAMGDLCGASGLQKEAVRFYRRFLVLHPQGPDHQTVSDKLDQLMDASASALLTEENEDHYEHITDIAPDFHTMTLSELYIRQNQLEMACNVLKEIIRREPDHLEAGIRLKEIEDRMMAPLSDTDRQTHGQVLQELSRWLGNISRIGSYAT